MHFDFLTSWGVSVVVIGLNGNMVLVNSGLHTHTHAGKRTSPKIICSMGTCPQEGSPALSQAKEL